MDKIDVLLAPKWSIDKITSVRVQITLEKSEHELDSPLFQFYKSIVGVPFLTLLQPVQLKDADGTLDYYIREKEIPKITLNEYHSLRRIRGDLQISYEVELKPVGKNPAFDLGYEDGGMNGSGMTFLPSFREKEYCFRLNWDLSDLPEGCRGIWSLGEGCIETVQPGSVLTESFYYAGRMKGMTKNNCGFYWFEQPGLPGEEVGSFVLHLFEQMAEFFHDGGEPYQIFSRKVPEVLTGRKKIGGTALVRSFLYLYPEEKPPQATTLKFLFPHELVHNWLKLTDEPFGTCTWYVEGTAEYYSLVLSDRFGMITREELLLQLNQRARDYYENPRIQVSNEYAGEHLFIDSEATLIPYGRGFFYLLHVNEIIKEATGGTKSLDDVVLAILHRTQSGEECKNEAWLEEVKKVTGLDVSKEFEEMQNGKIITPEVSSLRTPVRVVQCTGTQRETGKECVLYQFE